MFRELFRFCVVGSTGLAVDTAILVFLVRLFALDPRLAAPFAFGVAVSWNYALNRAWTFPLGRQAPLPRSYVVFLSVGLAGLGVRIGVMHLLIEHAGMGVEPWYVLASIIGIAAATAFNFLGSRYVAFAPRC